ncbi:MAG: ABC transporter permease [Deltaproteobacteria bacterium]|nr:ABC transporter permease [Deltaproteobacteria bacterium]MBW1961029.1 ABC transporter permease [Deltaproteobacteria bacterium]MBW2153368.1 ABC transporter permease [Deltaproteobacteria bacterium]
MNDLRKKQLRVFLRNRVAVVGFFLTVLVVLVALLAAKISPYDPLEQNVYSRLTSPDTKHLFGTDSYGRDVLSRVIYGSRISLAVGVCSILVGMSIGSLMGMFAAFDRGKIGNLIMRAVDVMMCFPAEIFAILFLVMIGQGLDKLIFSIGVVMTPRFARLAYGTTLSVREREYIEAARALGAKRPRIILKHIFPNILGEILVMSSLWTATAIRVEANLSFLGMGVPPPTPTWGNMVRTGVTQLTNAPWLSIFPGLAIMVAVLAFNLIGDGLRDVMDPKLQQG